MKLLRILFEQSQTPKALIVAGSAGAGKNHILSQLEVLGLPILDADNYTEDKEHEHYNNLSAASRLIDKEVQTAVENKESFIWNTTAGNSKKIEQIVDAGYEVAMVMVYTHPIVSIISNFSREKRSVPMSAVLSTWKGTYSLIEYYEQLLGDKFFLIENTRADNFEKEIQDFNQAASKGSQGIEQYISNLISSDPSKFTSTYSKPFEIEDKEALAAYEQEMVGVEYDKKSKSMEKALKKHFMSFWERGKTPPKGSMQTKVNAVIKTAAADKEKAEDVASEISNMISNKKLQDRIQSSDKIEDVRGQIQNFLAN